MKIKKICWYSNEGNHFNVTPAILVTPKEDGFIIAFKWWTRHLGFYITLESHNHYTMDENIHKS